MKVWGVDNKRMRVHAKGGHNMRGVEIRHNTGADDPGQLRRAVAQTGRAQLNLVRPAGAGLIRRSSADRTRHN